jgi:hypothetical protein
LLLGLFITLRWNNFDAPLIRDEGEYQYASRLFLQGTEPYAHSFMQKPPMVIYSYALAEVLSPNHFWFPRVLAALSVMFATGLLGMVARLEFGPGVALPAMWLMTPMVLFPGLEEFTANTEMFMLAPFLGAVAAFAIGHRSKRSRPFWFLAGLLGAVAFWYKYTVLPPLILIFAVWTIESWRAGCEVKLLARCWLLMVAGASISSLLVLAPFLVRDGGRSLWECTVAFNRYYATSAGFGLGGLRFRLSEFGTDWWILFALPLVAWFKPSRALWLWTTVFLGSWFTTAGSPSGHYYLVVMPFWALLSGAGIRQLADLLSARLSWLEVWVGGAVTALVVVLICIPDFSSLNRDTAQFARAMFHSLDTPFVESPQVAKRVAELTSPNDRVFVAGSEPQILCYAKRWSPTRFVIMYPLMIPSPLASRFQQQAIQDLDQQPPEVIVLARGDASWLKQPESPPDFFQHLEKLLTDKYERVGGFVPGEPEGRWMEPLSDSDWPGSSLVIFKRKKL